MAERSKTPETKPAAEPETWTKVSDAGSRSQGWHKTTRSMSVPGGTLYMTTTEHRATGAGGGRILACSEALVFVPQTVDIRIKKK